MKILIVDDNLVFLKQLQKYLRANNFDVDIADGGKKAIEMLASNKYSAVVLDLKMPDMSGMEVLKWACLLYTSPSPRDRTRSRMPSSA